MGWYGARILHPRCLDPLRGREAEICLRPVDAADGPGTQLVERRDRHAGQATGQSRGGVPGRGASRVAALTTRRNVAVVRVSGAAMVNQPGVAGRVLGALGKAGVNVKAVASSMTSLSCTVDEADASLSRRTLRLLQESGATGVEQVSVNPGAALLGVVGDGVADDASIAARMLSVLDEQGIRVQLISHGPGDVGLSCVVPGADLDRALAELHTAFFELPRSSPSRAAGQTPDQVPDRTPGRTKGS